MKITTFVAKRLPASTKQQLLTLQQKTKVENLIFMATFGAVRNDQVLPVEEQFQQLSPKSELRVSIIKNAIQEANKRIYWPVRFRLRFVDGMSGQSFRFVLNSIMKSCESYLEIGTWKGSTACAALDGNNVSAWLIDNWSEFGGPAATAIRNISEFLGDSTRLTFVNSDFNKVDYSPLVKQSVDTYLFDGPHAREDHVNGAKIISQLQFDTLVYIVDDWNWDEVREGTLAGLDSLNVSVVYKLEIFPKSGKRFQYSRWHNGYCFFIIEKT